MVEKKSTGTAKKAETKAKPKEVPKEKVAVKSVSSKKAKVLSIKGQPKGDISLPEVFDTEYRPDLIQRAFVAEQSWDRQPYGSDPRAGFRTTADYYSRRKGYYRMTVNRGMTRLPRQKRPNAGLGEVRRVPHSKGGHRAHPPKAEKIWAKKMNEKEWILAFKAAIGATTNIELVNGEGRNHQVKDLTLPLIIENAFESTKKTKEVYDVLEALGLGADLERAADKKIKAGKARTGKQKARKSVLVVVSGDCEVQKAASNVAGLDIVDAENLNVNLLAPGGYPGRLTLWTEGAIEKLSS